MSYYRIALEPGAASAQDLLLGEADLPDEDNVWPSGSGRPFVLVTRKAWRPPTDIYETATEVVVKMEIAGFNENDLAIIIQDDLLTIRGRRADGTERHKIGYHRMGIRYGEFASEIALPGPVVPDQVHAEYVAGFLTVVLPKASPRAAASVRITISE